jgi:5-methylcytosine-specific restriction endonuclease McrA
MPSNESQIMPLPLDLFLGEPNPRSRTRLLIHVVDFICWSHSYTPKEVGQVVTTILAAAHRRDWRTVKSYPFVLRVVKGTALREHIPLSLRRQILATGRCALCGSTDSLQVDHIKPYSKGGTNEAENLQCLCRPCNRRKYDKWEGDE